MLGLPHDLRRYPSPVGPESGNGIPGGQLVVPEIDEDYDPLRLHGCGRRAAFRHARPLGFRK